MKFPVSPFQPRAGKQTGKMRTWKYAYAATLYSGGLTPSFTDASHENRLEICAWDFSFNRNQVHPHIFGSLHLSWPTRWTNQLDLEPEDLQKHYKLSDPNYPAQFRGHPDKKKIWFAFGVIWFDLLVSLCVIPRVLSNGNQSHPFCELFRFFLPQC